MGIYPLFIQDESNPQSIDSMPGCFRHSLNSLLNEVHESYSLGIKSFMLFPSIPSHHQSPMGEQSYNPNNIVHRVIRIMKKTYPDSIVVTDVALDPYSSKGHDGIVDDKTGEIWNDGTICQLVKQAISHARAGADMVAPSDMMDGRIGVIRNALDAEGFSNVAILAYTAKYASSFYGPFRDALHSHPFGDKKSYQQDPGNSGREAIREALLDVNQGADILMVKPGMMYADIIRQLRDLTNVPIAAYQVSGEYAMMKAAVERQWLNERKIVMESLTCLKRAGSDIIVTYYAKQAAQWLGDEMFV